MAGFFTDQTLEEIRQRVDIVELIGTRIRLKRAGAVYKACCPFHNEKTPSFVVTPARNSYHCFGCGAHGDVFKFLMQMDGLPFPEAVRNLARQTGVPLDERKDPQSDLRQGLWRLHAELAQFYARCLVESKQALVARKYLAARRLDEATVKRFGIGYAPMGRQTLQKWAAKHDFTLDGLVAGGLLVPPREERPDDDYFDRFRGRLMFPIRDAAGRVVAFSGRVLDPDSHPAKYLNSPETPIFNKGRVLYGLDLARGIIVRDPRREAIVCEGQIDVIRCHASGFETAVAAQGTAFTPEHVRLLKRYADSVVLVFDGDEAGAKAALRTGRLFLQEGLPVRVASMPPGQDPDSILRDQGPETFQALLDKALSLVAFQVRCLGAAERDPTSVDAVGRISAEVLETLADCSKAVLRSHLTQEAATMLHLPVSALEQDLDGILSQRDERAKIRQQVAAASPPPAGKESADREPAPRPRKPPRQASVALNPAGVGLCELLVHHSDDESVLGLVRTWMPLGLLFDPPVRAVVTAALEMQRTGNDCLSDLASTGDAATKGLMSRLVLGDSRMLSSRDLTPLQAAEDLVARLWIDALKVLRAKLNDQDATQGQWRFRLTSMIKKLEQQTPWSERVALIEQARRLLDEIS